MIRKFRDEDLDRVMEIWLNSNLQAHYFISRSYWISNVDVVKSMLPMAEVYVYEQNNHIEAFAGIDNGYIAGIFVSEDVRSKGIGRLLLKKCKGIYKELSLRVYEKNGRAVRFYLREGFAVKTKQTDTNTGEIEYFMTWE
ncbi:MAG: GNAT family N-acetyltransferase [Anaeromusa sp.]|uniref:GNAT family N-acetyltransferase n=1 Tax=Anaeromusa sp. TaxID=1872520 RepID=UPI002B20994C|nr:GNAT family N-acetyltransferase [Anaeromusa sp.]MEA4835232.1 GNAT family N-acetyltransferase [Anaeromusa sp.]